jgi:NAD(P)-dependent dehydrogenase (short-subunit alcohol dehydrogenase family)
MIDSRKKTALVTGASSGMGKAIAKRLISDGYKVYVAARQVEKMDDLARMGATPLRMDISNEDEIRAAIETILAQAGGRRRAGQQCRIRSLWPRRGHRH